MKHTTFKKDLCLACKRCVLACAIQHSPEKSLHSIVLHYPMVKPRLRVGYKNAKISVRKCRHCKKPKCIEVCEPKALYKRDDGAVLIDYSKCNGCLKCIEACPFDAIFKILDKKIPIKCDLCEDAEILACVSACNTGALAYSTSAEE